MPTPPKSATRPGTGFGTGPAGLPPGPDRDWARRAMNILQGDGRRSADTHLVKPTFRGLKGISIYLKDESTHPTGSLKHRLARSLFLYGICNGKIRRGTTLVEASSGSTAVSEAYFAELLDLPFVAVVPRGTSRQKIEAIERYGARCHFVDAPDQIYGAATALAEESGGYYLDQFTYAERATDWRGNNNIAESIFSQMSGEAHPVPRWIVMSAGTGGTAATLGRYIRYRNFETRLCVVDVEHSAFFDAYRLGDRSVRCAAGSGIEGVGRPRVEPSFIPEVIDYMMKIPDLLSIAAMRVLSRRLFRRVGGSTGANFFALAWVAAQMMEAGEEGAIVSLICDSGDRYSATYYDDDWLAERNMDVAPVSDALERFLEGGAPFPHFDGVRTAAADG